MDSQCAYCDENTLLYNNFEAASSQMIATKENVSLLQVPILLVFYAFHSETVLFL